MDLVLDPPPLADQQTAAFPPAAAAAAAAAAANPTPAQAPVHHHPPYAEMITAAIAALNERNGSSKRAIAKYIETTYSDLPSTHSALLTHHLKRLKTSGQLLMVKHSYKLPRSALAPAPAPVNGAVNAVTSDPASAVPKRRPGRPPKPKPDAIQVAVPVFEPPINVNAAPAVVVPGAEPPPNAAVGPGLANGLSGVGRPVRGRGRPPKRVGLKRGPGRPPKSGGSTTGGGVRRGRGRPKVGALAAQGKGAGRPRGRPPKPINVVEGLATGAAPVGGAPAAPGGVGGVGVGVGVAPVVGKRRGRPPRAGNEAKRQRIVNAEQQAKKPRNLSGKPLGRPKKKPSATTVNRSPDSQLLVAYLDLKAKLENLQSRISQTANLIKPSLNNEAAINALQELELIAMNVTTPAPIAQNPQQPQPQPEPEQYPQPQS